MIGLTSYNTFMQENFTNLVVKDVPANLPNEKRYNHSIQIIWGNQDENNTITVDLSSIVNNVRTFKYTQKREDFLILAVKNCVRKLNTTELNEDLNNGYITEDEYYHEIDVNANKYVLKCKNLDSPEDALLIVDLVDKIGDDIRDFSTSEISEMFSIKESQLISNIKALSHTLRLNGHL